MLTRPWRSVLPHKEIDGYGLQMDTTRQAYTEGQRDIWKKTIRQRQSIKTIQRSRDKERDITSRQRDIGETVCNI